MYSAAHGGDSWDLWEVGLSPDTWVASTEPKRLTTGADLQAHASIVATRLVFSSLTQTINVWSLPLDAKEGRVVGPARRVTATSAVQWWPSVSEDGRRLMFRGDKGGLWIRELDTNREVLLVPSQRPLRGFITADGSRVAFMVRGTRKGKSLRCRRRVACPNQPAWTAATASWKAGRETKRDCSTKLGIPARFSSWISDRARRGVCFTVRQTTSGRRDSPRTTIGPA